MTDARSHAPSRARQQWMVAIVIAAGLALVSIALVAGAVVGYRINMTPSEPLGVWRIRPLQRPPAIGDLVFICPPETEAFSEARMRGYPPRRMVIFCCRQPTPETRIALSTA